MLLSMTMLSWCQQPAKHKNGAIIGGGASDPTGVEAGQIWWDSDDLKYRVYNGSVWNDLIPPSTGATQLSELNDVDNGILPTNKFVLIANGVDWYGRLLVEADISDLSHFTPTSLLSDYSFTDNSSNWDIAFSWGDHSTEGYLTSFSETNDLTASVTWDDVPDVNITETSVRQWVDNISDIGMDGYSAINYTPIGGSDLDAHWLGLDTELSTITNDISINESDITGLQSSKADKSNVLELDNTTAFTPDADYEPATKKFVEDNLYSYDRLYEDATVSGTQDLDYSLYEVFNFTLTGITTLTESNLPTSGTYSKVILINITGNYALTYPANWSTNISGTYDGTVNNTIAVWYVKSGVYKVQVSQPD